MNLNEKTETSKNSGSKFRILTNPSNYPLTTKKLTKKLLKMITMCLALFSFSFYSRGI